MASRKKLNKQGKDNQPGTIRPHGRVLVEQPKVPGQQVLGPIGPFHGGAAQRQEMAVQTGGLVGNRGLARMIAERAGMPTPGIQRGPGETAAINTLISQQAVNDAIANNPTLQAIHQRIEELTPKTEEEDLAGRDMGGKKGEEKSDRRTDLVSAYAELRPLIAAEVTAENLGGNEMLAKAIRRRFNIQMARIAPFYTQWWNKNILGTEKNPARMRTCNVSTIGMVLEGLGKATSDFTGSQNLMDAIAASVEQKTPAADLRFPDFLQILAIYLEMVGSREGLAGLAVSDPDAFKNKVTAAGEKAYNRILSSENFHKFTRMFDVSIEVYDPDLQKALVVFGDYYRDMDSDFEDYLDKKGKQSARGKEKKSLYDEFIEKRKSGYRWRATSAGRQIESLQAEMDLKTVEMDAVKEKLAAYRAALEKQTGGEEDHAALQENKSEMEDRLRDLESSREGLGREIAAQRLKQAASEAVGSRKNEEENVESALPLEVYKRAFIPLMQDLLGSGAQVIVIISNHFVKLQAISEENIIVHDPAGWGGANKVVSWELARQHGYFLRYNVVR